MKKLDKNQKIRLIVLVILVLAAILFYYSFAPKEDKFIVGKTLRIKNSSDYLVQYEDGNYYLMKANADIKFSVESDEKEIKYTITDEENQEVKTQVKKKKKHFEIIAEKKYEAGRTYKITLENASFTEEKLKDIKTLYFTIVRPNANTQVLNDEVIKVNQDTITNVKEKEDNYTLTSNKEFKQNDILYYQKEEERLAFKVDSIKKENNNYIIETSAPTPEEIFKELDIYGEFHLKIKDFISDEELKDYIKVAIEEEGILDKIVPKAQAASIFSTEIEHKKDGSVKVRVSLRLSGGEKAVFDNWLEEHDVKLDLEFLLKLTSHSDITLSKQDIGLKLEMELGTGFHIESTNEDFLAIKNEMKDNQELDITLSTQKMNQLKTDKTKIKKPLAWTMICAPEVGIAVRFELGLLNELELALESSLSAKEAVAIDFGYSSKNGFYKNFDFSTKENEFSILGKGEAKFGLTPKVTVAFLGIFSVGAEAPVGVYGEGQINYMNSKNNQEFDGSFEFGAFVDITGSARIKFLKTELAKAEVTYEKKVPIITLEKTTKEEDLSIYAGTYKTMYGDTKELYVKENKLYYRFPSGEEKEINFNDTKEDGGIIVYEDRDMVFSALYLYPIGVEFSAMNILQNEKEETDQTKIRLFQQGSGVNGIESVYYKVDSNNCEEKLLNGDFSCYAGTYTYVLGYKESQTSKFTLDKEGKITGDGFSETYNNKPVSIQKEEDGTYRIEHQFYFETPSGEKELTSQYFYLAPTDVSLKYYSTQGTNEETDSSTIRIKKNGFIAADTNVVYQKTEGESCEEKLLKGDFSCYAGTYTSEEDVKRGTTVNTLTLKKDGSFIVNTTSKGKAVSVTKKESGSYQCTIKGTFSEADYIGFYIYPIGVPVNNGAKSDTIRIRYIVGYGSVGTYIKD